MGTLLEQQRRFARALSGDVHAALADVGPLAGPTAESRLAVYANNARIVFEEALRQTYPVIERRVGAAFFRQLARDCRRDCPAPASDLHEVGRAFPAWLEGALAASGYEWLADLARLEWACADAATESPGTPIGIDALATVPAERLGGLRLVPCRSMRWLCSPWPVFSVWQANQPTADGASVPLSLGEQAVVLRAGDDAPLVHRVAPSLARFAGALGDGASLGAAIERAGLPLEDLAPALAFLFTEGYIVEVGGRGSAD